jgi:hypothetical protein
VATETLRHLALEANQVLNSYVAVHDQIYGFSLRKVVPLPGLFRPIGFESARASLRAGKTRLELIRGVLATIGTDSEFARLLDEYAAALIEAISSLAGICERLSSVASKKGAYPDREYKEDSQRYLDLVSHYRALGTRLNAAYARLE